jgi:hypothetical protein
MIADAAIVAKTDHNARAFCDAIQWRVIKYKMESTFSEQEELRLMTIASKGVRQLNAINRQRRVTDGESDSDPSQTGYGGYSKDGA